MPKTKLAKVSLTPKGAWDSATAYEALDVVRYGGSAWLAKQPSQNVEPRENAAWMQIADKGDKGSTGATGTISNIGSFQGSVAAMNPQTFWAAGNPFAFIPPERVIIEQTTDGGVTWTDAGVSDDKKRFLFGNDNPSTQTSFSIPTLDGKYSTLCGVRITISAYMFNVPAGTAETDKFSYWTLDNYAGYAQYYSLQAVQVYCSTKYAGVNFKLYTSRVDDPENFVDRNFDFTLSGLWPGGAYIIGDNVSIGGYNDLKTNANIRMTFFTASDYNTSNAQDILRITASASNIYVADNNAQRYRYCVHRYDDYQNCTFPADLTVTGDLNVKGNIVPNSYKLIETITLTDDTTSGIIRTAKPDGTAYKFSKVIIIASAKLATDLLGNFGCSFIDSSGAAVGGNFIGSISANQDFRLYVASFAIENGVLFGRMGNFASGTMYNYQDFNMMETINSYFFGGAAITIDQAKLAYLNDIVQIRINQFNQRPFASGSVFKIYAVDA